MITDLTEKCYNTILASKTNFVCFYGPAGTGKTETFKDFCRITGKNVIVLNCSSEMTPEEFQKSL